ncbi:hypothetical protein ACH32B_16935 [Enterobacter dykesii]
MSNDIATISLRVNTSELERGNQALDRFQETASAAAGKADDLNSTFRTGIDKPVVTRVGFNQSFTLTAYVFAIFPQTLPAWGFAIWDATGKLVLTNESRVLSDLQTVGSPGASGGINIDQTLSGSWAVAPAQLGQTIIVNNSTQPPTIYTINAYSSCRFNGGSTRINAGGTSTGTGSPGGGTNTGISLTAINTATFD